MTMVDEAFTPVNRLAANSRNIFVSWKRAALRSFQTRATKGAAHGAKGRCVVATVTDRHEAPAVDSLPLDTKLIADSTDAALKMQLNTSTREDINARTTAIIEQLTLLLGEELGAVKDPAVRHLCRQAYRLLELSERPTKETPAFSAFFFLRDMASLTRRLLWAYAEENDYAP